ncbi:hypothetical protein NBRC116602_30050 [Hyphomicrobiales bacterium 4NK60-0047b]
MDIDIDDELNKKEQLKSELVQYLQSGHINFLIGSGASCPAIETFSDIEAQLDAALEDPKELSSKLSDFFKTIFDDQLHLIEDLDLILDQNTQNVLDQYEIFIDHIEQLLHTRRNKLIPTQATIFTTNYDLYLEAACEGRANIRLNDGFLRNPTLGSKPKFSTSHFFTTLLDNSYSFNYEVKVPSINLIKLHGSLSWVRSDGDIVYDVTRDNFIKDNPEKHIALILPSKDKFRETVLGQIYSDLLRTYTIELSKENALLLVFGFSFEDEHILDLTLKALRNPTLKIYIFCYSNEDEKNYESKFEGYSNVACITPNDLSCEKVEFSNFNDMLDIRSI